MKSSVEGLRNRGTTRRRPGEASWVISAVLVVLFVGGLAAARGVAPVAGLLLVAASFALLALAGWLWGSDTRDGTDWTPREPGTLR